MNANNKILILLLACGIATALTAEAQSASGRLTAASTPPPVRTLSIRNGALSAADKATMPSRDIVYDADGITVTYTIDNSRMARKSLSEAVTFSIDGFNLIVGDGLPALPSRTDMFALRRGETPHVTILEQEYVDYHLEIAPAMPIQPESEAPRAPRPIDEYKGFYPQSPVQPGDVQYRKDDGILFLSVTPIQYDMENQVARIYTTLKYHVSLEAAPLLTKQASGDDEAARLLADCDEEFLDAAGVMPIRQRPQKVIGDGGFGEIKRVVHGYLIITSPAYRIHANKLANWRRATGFQAVVHTMRNPSSEAVKNIIKKAYNNEPLDALGVGEKPFTKAKSLTYVLILGDHTIIPAAEESDDIYNCTPHYLSDLSYYCMDGENDILPDVQYGRLLVNTIAEARTVVSKIINYEKDCPDAETKSFNTSYHIAQFQDNQDNKSDGTEDNGFTFISEELRTKLKNGTNLTITPHYKYTGDSIPMKWNNEFGNGQPLPFYLTHPAFSWDADTNEVINAISVH